MLDDAQLGELRALAEKAAGGPYCDPETLRALIEEVRSGRKCPHGVSLTIDCAECQAK